MLLVGRQEGHPACNKRVVDAGVVISLERGADLHMAQLMPLPLTVSCFSKIQTGFTFLVPAHPGSPGQRAVKWVCVCECRLTYVDQCDQWLFGIWLTVIMMQIWGLDCVWIRYWMTRMCVVVSVPATIKVQHVWNHSSAQCQWDWMMAGTKYSSTCLTSHAEHMEPATSRHSVFRHWFTYFAAVSVALSLQIRLLLTIEHIHKLYLLHGIYYMAS